MILRETTHKLHCCNEERCFVCDGGLAFCEDCGGGEGDLPTDCPGERMSDYQREMVYAGNVDYIGGKWHITVEKVEGE